MRRKRFPHYWPFVSGIHWSPVDALHRATVMQTFDVTLLCNPTISNIVIIVINIDIYIYIYIKYTYWMTFIYRGRVWRRTGPRLDERLMEVPTHGLTAWFRYGCVGTHGRSTWPALPVFSLPCLFVMDRQGGYQRLYGLVGSGHEIDAY